MKKLVIKVFWGGLGDHLLYSPVPRLAKVYGGYDKVYISNYSNYRNPNTKRLVWEYNPYVDGFVDKDADYLKESNFKNGNLVDSHINFFGLLKDGVINHEAEVYYKCNLIPEFENCVIYDPNHISPVQHPTAEQVRKYFEKVGYPNYQMKQLFDNSYVSGIPELDADNLERFCDIIFSCSKFYCFTSGPATLAPALGKSANVLYCDGNLNRIFHHSKLNNYIKIGNNEESGC